MANQLCHDPRRGCCSWTGSHSVQVARLAASGNATTPQTNLTASVPGAGLRRRAQSASAHSDTTQGAAGQEQATLRIPVDRWTSRLGRHCYSTVDERRSACEVWRRCSGSPHSRGHDSGLEATRRSGLLIWALACWHCPAAEEALMGVATPGQPSTLYNSMIAPL